MTLGNGSGELRGKRALVTGGSRGIGAAVVRRLLEEGAEVLATARTTAYPAPEGAAFVTADIRTEAGTQALAATVQETFGGVDIVVHNAGGARAGDSAVTIPDADWQDALDLNLLAAVRLNALLTPGMRDQGSGAIVHISTAALLPPVPVFAHYQAAKAGLESYSRALAAELAPFGVRVNALAPGRTATPGGEETRRRWASTDEDSGATGTPPLGREGLPGDIANAVLFLVSDQSSWITGTSFSVDGGEYPRN
ncbi:NAD(P)-dependent dehydrogenase (short-subunit alcohol dehydrogenase family) [Nonomuraea fuscirosea]|uniref:NAD(P)-dependent dehydrogenase (Short-subunit alcohol dehydrogenase family) n=1 Tax=Nonomuraea fuscirosea TaxID=1291556 RepID=A0A2T0MW01_9ACTN|nr:oxidoreductase [Nonomuraea fuscirosea]PRX63114.1 NAD(P)-dependent dehydrogenase (short-subunit alcohol dehydrogenase family) [Nonomuraea fuscirosea]